MSGPLPAVQPPRIVAIATDKNITPLHTSYDPWLTSGPQPKLSFGQDYEHSPGRRAPWGHSVGTSEAVLKPTMETLLKTFASKDRIGLARRLFDAFLAKQQSIMYYRDQDLNAAADAHKNINYFCFAALGAPMFGIIPAPGTTRIHQALQAANWDVTKLVAPTDLGVPAFNTGDYHPVNGMKTEDWANGLMVMINGVQHVYVIATHYQYNKDAANYSITLKFLFYDIFGLDDNDLGKYGAQHVGDVTPTHDVGFTAWWQLQHQHDYAPLVTRIELDRTFSVPAV
jgi:hypothetical protein